MSEKSWQDQFGSKVTVRSGEFGYDIVTQDSDGSKVNVLLPYNSEFATDVMHMYIKRSAPDTDRMSVRDNELIARRIYLGHEVGHAVGLDATADALVAMYQAAAEDPRYAALLVALFGAADDVD